ncbi:MAG: hypothetical protein WDN46_16465 [Methylocella sp.]
MGERESADSDRTRHLWYTRCNVPTASGIAFNLGWLSERYAADGVTIGALQDAPADIARSHYDHLLPSLIREGGNVPALVARSNGSRTRLVGLTWIDERQAIVVRPDSKIATPRDLAGARIAVPSWTNTRMTSMARDGAAWIRERVGSRRVIAQRCGHRERPTWRYSTSGAAP